MCAVTKRGVRSGRRIFVESWVKFELEQVEPNGIVIRADGERAIKTFFNQLTPTCSPFSLTLSFSLLIRNHIHMELTNNNKNVSINLN